MEELFCASEDRSDDERAGQRLPTLPEGGKQARLDVGTVQKQIIPINLFLFYYYFCKVSHALAYVTASKNGVSEPEIEDFISLDDKVGDIEGLRVFPKGTHHV